MIDELKTLAVELQDLIQAKVGTNKFVAVYSRIRHSVLDVRRERKVARVIQVSTCFKIVQIPRSYIQVSTNPEAAAKRKIQRNVVKKGSRKRKMSEYAYVT